MAASHNTPPSMSKAAQSGASRPENLAASPRDIRKTILRSAPPSTATARYPRNSLPNRRSSNIQAMSAPQEGHCWADPITAKRQPGQFVSAPLAIPLPPCAALPVAMPASALLTEPGSTAPAYVESGKTYQGTIIQLALLPTSPTRAAAQNEQTEPKG